MKRKWEVNGGEWMGEKQLVNVVEEMKKRKGERM